jgi:hypothetical protein
MLQKLQRRPQHRGGRVSVTTGAHESDEALIDRLHRGALSVFPRYVIPLNGLVAERHRPAPARESNPHIPIAICREPQCGASFDEPQK